MSGGHTEKAGGDDAPKKKGGNKLILLAVPVVLLAAVAGLWFSGILPGLLGMGKKPVKLADAAQVAMQGAAMQGGAMQGGAMEGGAMGAELAAAASKAVPGTYLDVPEILANLNVSGRRPTYLKLHAKLELGGAEDVAPVTAAMPRILDMFQTYMRDMRPEELRGSEGTYRLREELLSRAEVAVAPAHVTDVLFEEMIVE